MQAWTHRWKDPGRALPYTQRGYNNLNTYYTHKYGPRCKKTCLRRFANNKDTDQPAHPRSLISAFVIRFFESFVSKLATSEILIF